MPKQFDPVADTETYKFGSRYSHQTRPNNSIRLRILKLSVLTFVLMLACQPKQFDPVADTETEIEDEYGTPLKSAQTIRSGCGY